MSVDQFLIEMRYEGATPKGLSRELPRIIKDALYAMGLYWHDNFRAKHFLPSGAKEYGYTPRKGEGMSTATKGFWRSYMGRKLRMKHHQNPLTWSGESRERTRIRDVRATRNQVRIVLHANALNWKNPNSSVEMWWEMTTISAGEQKVLAEVFRQKIMEGIRGIRYMETMRFAA